MKVRLLHPERDPELAPRLPWRLQDLVDDDLELRRVYRAMSANDEFLLETAKKVVPLAVVDPDIIVYRQQVLADCLANRAVVRQMYDIAVEGVEVRRKLFLGRDVPRPAGHPAPFGAYVGTAGRKSSSIAGRMR